MRKTVLILITSFLFINTLQAAFTVRNGKLVSADVVPTKSIDDHYKAGLEAVEKKDWHAVVENFRVVSTNAPLSPIGQESSFWLGIGWYYLEEFDFANEAFNTYLKSGSNPAHFQDAVEYKYMVAENFRNGARRRPFGTKQLPKWASGTEMAADIYDEVIAAMPSGDMAAKAYYSKGWLLWEMKDYRGSIDSFTMMIKRFPKHELTPDSYLMITYVYLDQCRLEFQNPDLIAFAEMVVKKFEQDFPREERLELAKYNVLCIKELYAKGLYDTGQFYERTGNPDASIIYYQNAMTKFPDTQIAERCKGRLMVICPDAVETAAVDNKIPTNS